MKHPEIMFSIKKNYTINLDPPKPTGGIKLHLPSVLLTFQRVQIHCQSKDDQAKVMQRNLIGFESDS